VKSIAACPTRGSGELRFTGSRSYPGWQAHGAWKVQPPGFDTAIAVTFETPNTPLRVRVPTLTGGAMKHDVP
jgi:hypothetical protein